MCHISLALGRILRFDVLNSVIPSHPTNFAPPLRCDRVLCTNCPQARMVFCLKPSQKDSGTFTPSQERVPCRVARSLYAPLGHRPEVARHRRERPLQLDARALISATNGGSHCTQSPPRFFVQPRAPALGPPRSRVAGVALRHETKSGRLILGIDVHS